ncbi:biotin-dependent carboxyltransferase family protein [Paenibacillus yanchengensis]|uniref:Biotin-dependent carboxyltransferase family protein n=1 Tax=Paenibacillus yanchengensis TaxID=2035833 RepID=A0ABW4YG04_9BACL
MALVVIRAGTLATIQDGGRFGYQQVGVGPSGAMDLHALQTANMLVGNESCVPAIEIMYGETSFLVERPMLIAICGFGMKVEVTKAQSSVVQEQRTLLPLWRPVAVSIGMQLYFSPEKKGLAMYMAIWGGVQAAVELGSSSTALRSGLGGLPPGGGKSLAAGDRITHHHPSEQAVKIYKSFQPMLSPTWFANAAPYYPQTNTAIRIIVGAQFAELTEQSKHRLLHTTFRVSSQSDRMGYRLQGELLKLANAEELISEPVATGTMQLPPSGEPIILLADRQTTGGYPRIAHVCTIDLPKLAQLKPGDKVTFQLVSLQEAEALLLQQAQSFALLKTAITLKLR